MKERKEVKTSTLRWLWLLFSVLWLTMLLPLAIFAEIDIFTKIIAIVFLLLMSVFGALVTLVIISRLLNWKI